MNKQLQMLGSLDGSYYYKSSILPLLTGLGKKMLLLIIYLVLLTMIIAYQLRILSQMNTCFQFQLIPLGMHMLITTWLQVSFWNTRQKERKGILLNKVQGIAG